MALFGLRDFTSVSMVIADDLEPGAAAVTGLRAPSLKVKLAIAPRDNVFCELYRWLYSSMAIGQASVGDGFTSVTSDPRRRISRALGQL